MITHLITASVAGASRVTGVLGRMSMYRLVLASLVLLAVIAFVLAFVGLVVPTPLALVATLAVLLVVGVLVDLGVRSLFRVPVRFESTVVTAFILLFVLRPTVALDGLLGIAIAAAVAAASKYLLAWRGRHVLNPAAVGATVVTAIASFLPLSSQFGSSAWWVGTPVLAAPVIVLGIAVLWRTEKVRVAALFLVIAVVVSFVRAAVQFSAGGLDFAAGEVLGQILWASPFLFLGAFMLSEPLTLPPRRWQQYVVAAVVGVLAGWPINVGLFTLGQERALLVGNLVAFALAWWAAKGLRTGVRLTVLARLSPAPATTELVFRVSGHAGFSAGQYLELDVPHRRPDPKGTRREFSIVSAPADLPELRIAYRDREEGASTFKRALRDRPRGSTVSATGIWGDFTLPRDPTHPILMLAAGIGITPFVSQLRQLRLDGDARDIVLVVVAPTVADVPFREELRASGVRVVFSTRDEPDELREGWSWTGGGRLAADALHAAVPDLASRRVYVSGPPRLIADLAPALRGARSIHTDAFSGY